MSLFTDIILRNQVSQVRYAHGLFYDPSENSIDQTKYSNINIYDTYTDAKIQQLQIAKLRDLEKGKGVYSKQYKEVFDFIQNANTALMQLQGYTDKGLQQISEQLMASINALIFSNKEGVVQKSLTGKGKNQHTDSQILQQEFYNNLTQLQNALVALRQASPQGLEIPTNIIDIISKTLRKSKNNKFYINTKGYAEKKWQEAENIAAGIVSSLAPNVEGLRIDKLFVGGKASITDVFAIPTDITIPLVDETTQKIGINMVIQSGKKVVKSQQAMTLIDFLDTYKNLKINETIHITQEDEEVLRQASAFSLQVKSAYQQGSSILSEAKRNSIFLGQNGLDFNETELWRLYNNFYYYFSKQSMGDSLPSDILTNYFNYSLGEHIDQTALTKNQLYFTANGIVTASEWMTLNNKILKFNSPIKKLQKAMLSSKQDYNFQSM